MSRPGSPEVSSVLRMALLLLLGAFLASGADHPLDTVTRRLPAVAATTQVTEEDGAVLILTADPEGRILREEPGGRFLEVETGLSGVEGLWRLGATWCGLAGGTLWKSASWPDWEEVASPGLEPIVALRVLNGEFWGWTWGGLEWDDGSPTDAETRPSWRRDATGTACGRMPPLRVGSAFVDHVVEDGGGEAGDEEGGDLAGHEGEGEVWEDGRFVRLA